MSAIKANALDLTKSADRALCAPSRQHPACVVINFTMWFAVTFWVFLETRSVLATGMVSGIFLVTTAASGIWSADVGAELGPAVGCAERWVHRWRARCR